MTGARVAAWVVCVVAALVSPARAQPAGQEEYVVQPKDTLYSIARRFGTRPEVLVQLNRLADPDRLQVGQRLRVPLPGSAPRPVDAGRTHVVERGDTLWRLARRYGTTPEDIARANGMHVLDTLQVGQVLRIPGQRDTPLPRVQAAASRGLAVVSLARRFLGTPYRWGGTGDRGFDCSGFLYAVFSRLGLQLPRTSYEMFRSGRPVPRGELQPGDLVFFTTYAPGPSHAGIYLGRGYFIHASSAGGGVRIDPMSKPYYSARYLGARRYF